MKIGEKPKVYLVIVWYVSFWPSTKTIVYKYSTFSAVGAHILWLNEQFETQNGKGGVRKNVVKSFSVQEALANTRKDKKHPPLASFDKPKKPREIPAGGVVEMPSL